MFSPKGTGLMFTLLKCYWNSGSKGLFLSDYTGEIFVCDRGALWFKHPHGYTRIDQ